MSRIDDRIAQWRTRREQEDAARAAHGDLPIDLAVIASKAEALASTESEDADPILGLVIESLASQPRDSVGERRRIYDAIARGVEHGIERSDPQSDYAELRRRQVRTIIRLIEADVRAGLPILDERYRPQGLDDAMAQLVKGYRRRRLLSDRAEISRARRQAVLADEAYTIAIPEEEEPDLSHLREILVRVDARRNAGEQQQRPGLRAVMALLNYQFVLLKSESRVALLWTLVGPAVLIGLLMAVYYVSGIRTILNMDVPTFAMIGSTSWWMLRNIIFRTTASFHSQRALLNFRAFSPAMLGLTTGLIYTASYSIVYLVLIGVGHLIGVFTLPADVLGVVFWLACIALAALAIGVIFGAISVIWPYFPRFAPAIERTLQLFSSVILVSEQLPVEYRPIVLWSPLAHAEQLLRSAYFAGYKSEDANARYFFLCLGITILVAVAAQRLVRSRSTPL